MSIWISIRLLFVKTSDSEVKDICVWGVYLYSSITSIMPLTPLPNLPNP